MKKINHLLVFTILIFSTRYSSGDEANRNKNTKSSTDPVSCMNANIDSHSNNETALSMNNQCQTEVLVGYCATLAKDINKRCGKDNFYKIQKTFSPGETYKDTIPVLSDNGEIKWAACYGPLGSIIDTTENGSYSCKDHPPKTTTKEDQQKELRLSERSVEDLKYFTKRLDEIESSDKMLSFLSKYGTPIVIVSSGSMDALLNLVFFDPENEAEIHYSINNNLNSIQKRTIREECGFILWKVKSNRNKLYGTDDNQFWENVCSSF